MLVVKEAEFFFFLAEITFTWCENYELALLANIYPPTGPTFSGPKNVLRGGIPPHHSRKVKAGQAELKLCVIFDGEPPEAKILSVGELEGSFFAPPGLNQTNFFRFLI